MRKSTTVGLIALRECEDPSDAGLLSEIFSQAIGQSGTAWLKPDGDTIEVNRDNLMEYIRLMLDYKLGRECAAQLNAFLDGFHNLIPREEMSMFGPDELGMLISGVPEIDSDEFANHVVYDKCYSRDHLVI
jgi:E3 ubiquitin-protein ligase HUWE1